MRLLHKNLRILVSQMVVTRPSSHPQVSTLSEEMEDGNQSE